MNDATENQAVGVSPEAPVSSSTGQHTLRLVQLGDANAVACEGDACLIVARDFAESAASLDQ